MKQRFQITGMSCAACSASIERTVKKLSGVNDVSVNLLQNSMTVTFSPQEITAKQIIAAVQGLGYGAFLPDGEQSSSKASSDPLEADIKSMKVRLWVSVLFLLPLMYLSMGHMMSLPLPQIFHGTSNAVIHAFTQLLLTLPVIYTNRKFFISGFQSLCKGHPNMDSLIAIGSSASLLYGIFAIYRMGYGLGHGDLNLVEHYRMDLYFESAATILTLITLGKFLEAKSKGKTSQAIRKLMDLAPKTATVERGENAIELPIEQVAVGDVVLIRPGSNIPVDGTIVHGATTIDQSTITGESLPIEKTVGDRVISATINQSGFIKIRADKVGKDTTLSNIIRLVEDANASKAPIAKLADRISSIFVPTVIVIALLTFLAWLLIGGKGFEFALSMGICVLVISCPCALGLATPVAIMVGTGKGAEHGILFKSAEALETAHTIHSIVLDKTGTITQGAPQVTDIVPAPGISEQELLRIAASIEAPSEHPLSRAIVHHAQTASLSLDTVSDFAAVSGKGITATLGGIPYLAGNFSFLQQNGIHPLGLKNRADAFAAQGKTPLYFAKHGTSIGVIAVADTIKPTSKHAIEAFQNMGIDVVMLTGDHQNTANAIATQLGINRVIAQVLPQEKEANIRALQQQHQMVAMVGDGINDTPALARADVGIAIGAGADIAIESADIVLLNSDLTDVVTSIKLSRAVIRNIKMNLFWAFFYNSIGIPLAAGAFYALFNLRLTPMFAAAAMSLSSVCVVLNALRLRLFQPADRIAATSNLSQTNLSIQEQSHMKKQMIIHGMNCPHCQAAVQKALSNIPGVTDVVVNLQAKLATIERTDAVTDEMLTAAVIEAGFTVVSVE